MNTPILALAFRPFFLVGSLWGALAIFYWAAFQYSLATVPAYFSPTAWHAHEMIFGFGGAILAGFLLTASKNWAKTRGVHGVELGALLAVWLAGRAALIGSAYLPGGLVAGVDLTFLPFLSLSLARTLSRGGRRVNFVFVFWLAILFVANLLMHLEALGTTAATARKGYLLGVDTFVVIMTVMGGRIIPLFTQNAIPGIAIKKSALVERIAVGSVVLYLVADLIKEASLVTAIAALLAGIASLVRAGSWKPLSTLEKPVLWVLHLGYGFIALGLLLRGASLSFLPIIVSAPIHLLTAGAMGLLILGMISRVSLGHTGRPIIAPHSMILAYGLVFLGAVVRVLVPIFFPTVYLPGIAFAAATWGAGFVIFAVVYWPTLTQPRIDGLEG